MAARRGRSGRGGAGGGEGGTGGTQRNDDVARESDAWDLTASSTGDWGGQAEFEVRRIQPYQAVKRYRCPGCDHEIPENTGHVVVVPIAEPELRRHWHAPCWQQESRRASGGGGRGR